MSVKIECKNCDRVFEEKKGETILHCPYCKSNLLKIKKEQESIIKD